VDGVMKIGPGAPVTVAAQGDTEPAKSDASERARAPAIARR